LSDTGKFLTQIKENKNVLNKYNVEDM